MAHVLRARSDVMPHILQHKILCPDQSSLTRIRDIQVDLLIGTPAQRHLIAPLKTIKAVAFASLESIAHIFFTFVHLTNNLIHLEFRRLYQDLTLDFKKIGVDALFITIGTVAAFVGVAIPSVLKVFRIDQHAGDIFARNQARPNQSLPAQPELPIRREVPIEPALDIPHGIEDPLLLAGIAASLAYMNAPQPVDRLSEAEVAAAIAEINAATAAREREERLREERQRQAEVNARLRAEQDAAYEKSLRIDQEKDRRRAELQQDAASRVPSAVATPASAKQPSAAQVRRPVVSTLSAEAQARTPPQRPPQTSSSRVVRSALPAAAAVSNAEPNAPTKQAPAAPTINAPASAQAPSREEMRARALAAVEARRRAELQQQATQAQPSSPAEKKT